MKASNIPIQGDKQIKRPREKKKLRSSEKANMDELVAEKSVKDLTKTCTAVDIDTISCIIEQSYDDNKIDDSITAHLADDVSYLLREIINNARLRMRHSKRSTLKVTDIDSAMESSRVERIYGPVDTKWILRGDYYAYEDITVNLANVAFASVTFKQNGPPYITSSWLSNNYEQERKYYESVCNAVFSHDKKITKLALDNLKKNRKIGNIITLFLSFGFFAWIADKGNKSVILDVLRCLARNPCSSRTQPGNALKLLLTVLVSELFLQPSEDSNDVPSQVSARATRDFQEDVSATIYILIKCWPSTENIVLHTIQNFMHRRTRLPRPVVYLLCSMGEHLTEIYFWNNLLECATHFDVEETWRHLLEKWKETRTGLCSFSYDDYEFRHSVWYAAAHIYRTGLLNNTWERIVATILGDASVALFPHFGFYRHSLTQLPIRKKIILKPYAVTFQKKHHYSVHDVFEDYRQVSEKKIIIAYGEPKQISRRITHTHPTYNNTSHNQNSFVIIYRKPFALMPEHTNNCCKGHGLLFSV